jgi:hypothetical protein
MATTARLHAAPLELGFFRDSAPINRPLLTELGAANTSAPGDKPRPGNGAPGRCSSRMGSSKISRSGMGGRKVGSCFVGGRNSYQTSARIVKVAPFLVKPPNPPFSDVTPCNPASSLFFPPFAASCLGLPNRCDNRRPYELRGLEAPPANAYLPAGWKGNAPLHERRVISQRHGVRRRPLTPLKR